MGFSIRDATAFSYCVRLNPGDTGHTVIALTSHSPPPLVGISSRYPITLSHCPIVNRKSSTNSEISTPTPFPECVITTTPVSISYESTLPINKNPKELLPSQEPDFPSLIYIRCRYKSRNRTNRRRRWIRRLNIISHPRRHVHKQTGNWHGSGADRQLDRRNLE